MRSFDYDANPNIDPATIHTLASIHRSWHRGRDEGLPGRYTLAKQLNKTIACYGRVDLLCIDELGCAP